MIGVLQPRPPQFAAHLEPVAARQHEIEQDDIPGRLTPTTHGGFTVGRHFHFMAVRGQIFLETECDVGFVFHHQDASHVSPFRGARW